MNKELFGMAGGLADGAFGLIGQHMANKANQRLAREERNWNQQMWHMQNKYNHPIEQMTRMKQAGLNPHLMYGQGNVGNAGDVKGYSRANVENVAKGWQGFSQMIQNRQIAAQTDNVEANTAVQLQEQKNKEIDALLKLVNLDTGKFDLETKKKLVPHQVESARAAAGLAKVDLRYQRKTLPTRIKLTKGERELQQKKITAAEYDNQYKKLQADLAKQGLTVQDNVLLRQAMKDDKTRQSINRFLSGEMTMEELWETTAGKIIAGYLALKGIQYISEHPLLEMILGKKIPNIPYRYPERPPAGYKLP